MLKHGKSDENNDDTQARGSSTQIAKEGEINTTIVFKYPWRKPARSQFGYRGTGWKLMTDDPDITERLSGFLTTVLTKRSRMSHPRAGVHFLGRKRTAKSL